MMRLKLTVTFTFMLLIMAAFISVTHIQQSSSIDLVSSPSSPPSQ